MMKRVVGVTALMILLAASARGGERMTLKEGWALQSAAETAAAGSELSQPGADVAGWRRVSVPTTVLAALVADGTYPDPYYGTNLKDVPGYQRGRWLAMPPDSPFYPSWWYRTEFTPAADRAGRHLTLHLDGINYRANIWLNGKKVAGADEVVGMFRRFEFDVTDLVTPGSANALAVEVIGPGKLPRRQYVTKQLEATTGWDDHNPQPPDLNLGIWQDVYLTDSGPVRIKHPYVSAKLDLPGLDAAHLTVSAYVVNVTRESVAGELAGQIEGVTFSTPIALGPGEEKLVTFTPAEFGQLNLSRPRVWWPHPLGPPELYQLQLTAAVAGAVSDTDKVTFGIRELTTTVNDEGWRVYHINGRKILIRGGAWMTSDMLLRLNERRYEALVRYAREANLNMLRSEGFSIRETDEFYDLCDRYGVMVTQQIFGRNLPDEPLAIACVEDMLLRIRNHPSLAHFLGHDETFPTPTLDQAYRDLIAKYTPERTYQPHSGAFDVDDRFATGGTRTGTLELWTYAGPAHYYTHKDDGAWGFAQSGGIGGVVACLESVKRMVPADELWPPLRTESWSFHTVIQGGDYFIYLYKMLKKRYGAPGDIADFVRTAQALNYESARGMFEAYGRNKYDATGITTWKYDTAWPAALTWQYIDWYLLPTAAYYGAKKACEPVHVQYSYDDDSVWVVNTLSEKFTGLTVSARAYNSDMTLKYERSAAVDVEEDGKTEAFTIAWPEGLSRTYFLRLTLGDASGRMITDNLYWLSTVPDRPGKKALGLIPVTPSSVPDFKPLRELPAAGVSLECWPAADDHGEKTMSVAIKNSADALAFFVQAAVTKGPGGLEVAPSYWDDNYVSILPGEARTLSARFAESDLEGTRPVVRVEGWNVPDLECRP